MLSQDEHGFLLQLFAGVAIENFLKLRQGLRFILLHQRIERQQFQIVVAPNFGLNGFAGLGLNLDLQRAALMDPVAGRKVAPQFGAGCERGIPMP